MGAEISQLTPEQIEKLKAETPFTEEEMAFHLKRYAQYDTSDKGTNGIPLETLQNFPEFMGHFFINKFLLRYIDKEKQLIYPEQFLLLFAALSPKTAVSTKRKMFFKLFDVHNRDFLQYEEVFKMYKMMFPPGSLTDDQILDLVYRALELPELKEPGKVTYEDFCEIVSDGEIKHRFTVELQLPPP